VWFWHWVEGCKNFVGCTRKYINHGHNNFVVSFMSDEDIRRLEEKIIGFESTIERSKAGIKRLQRALNGVQARLLYKERSPTGTPVKEGAETIAMLRNRVELFEDAIFNYEELLESCEETIRQDKERIEVWKDVKFLECYKIDIMI